LVLAGYVRTFTLFNRSAMATGIFPMGRITGRGTVNGKSFDQSTSGFGDPMLEFDLNIIGPRAQKNLVDPLRYEPKFSVDVLADLAFPVGEYNSSQALNPITTKCR